MTAFATLLAGVTNGLMITSGSGLLVDCASDPTSLRPTLASSRRHVRIVDRDRLRFADDFRRHHSRRIGERAVAVRARHRVRCSTPADGARNTAGCCRVRGTVRRYPSRSRRQPPKPMMPPPKPWPTPCHRRGRDHGHDRRDRRRPAASAEFNGTQASTAARANRIKSCRFMDRFLRVGSLLKSSLSYLPG